MKLIALLVLVAAIALVCGQSLGAAALALLALLVMIGDFLEALEPSACSQNCNQGDDCDCGEA